MQAVERCSNKMLQFLNGVAGKTFFYNGRKTVVVVVVVRVSLQRKGYTNLDFNEARNDKMAAASAGPYANHFRLTPDR